MTQEIHKNDFGTLFKSTITDNGSTVNISGVTPTFIFEKPDGTVQHKTGSLFSDGSDGIASYTAPSGFLDTVGGWQMQVYLIFDSSAYYTDKVKFNVKDNL